ncbi:MAG: hypothetical protein A2494_00325 [Candidatus Lloydbacteria bacterium RIFOXYC12_FULL_46_25]|uniref:Uncharacterized protein n=1 Tax=Candidatus Lloydbacteria bacterium RIFOXYC12_FULL_46_25 TaxID=1798670 RepID=A0A1G2DUQ2_9BACT|nr:MAG: hypothetical protein A2494_00325 [Candidatus Lloydbacteria bacterium RIFOXYC12_FULL_46_25]
MRSGVPGGNILAPVVVAPLKSGLGGRGFVGAGTSTVVGSESTLVVVTETSSASALAGMNNIVPMSMARGFETVFIKWFIKYFLLKMHSNE